MGSMQSHENNEDESADDSPKVIRIERSDVPEEYRTVGVSHDVVSRILNLDNKDNEHMSDLKNQLSQEREENLKLREQIKLLKESNAALQKAASEGLSLSDLEERQRAFDETLEHVEKQYFSYRSENECRKNEEDIMECLKKNRNTPLNCESFLTDLKKCASDYREKVLKEYSHL